MKEDLSEQMLEKHDGIERSRERVVKNGEVFTPDSIVEQLLACVSEDQWKDPTKTFCDPTCGNGQILVNILKRRLAAGVSKKDAISTLYGVELMEDNCDLTRKRLAAVLGTSKYNDIIEHNIVCSDFFEWDFEHWCSRKEKIVMKHKVIKVEPPKTKAAKNNNDKVGSSSKKQQNINNGTLTYKLF